MDIARTTTGMIYVVSIEGFNPDIRKLLGRDNKTRLEALQHAKEWWLYSRVGPGAAQGTIYISGVQDGVTHFKEPFVPTEEDRLDLVNALLER